MPAQRSARGARSGRAAGFSYEEAAEICGTPLGTIKSRVARGRTALLEIMDGVRPLTRLDTVRDAGGFNDILAQLTAILPNGAPIAACV